MSSEERQFFGTDGVRAVADGDPMTPAFVLRLAQAAPMVLGRTSGSASVPRVLIGA